MIHETLQWASRAMSGKILQGDPQGSFTGVSTDTRILDADNLFFCLVGERDGHEFAVEAAQKGAAAVVIDQNHLSLKESLPEGTGILMVSDTLRALGDLAHSWRKCFSIPIVALTGSNGKTTTKELIKAILSTRYRVLATEGNFNNLIGVPKTLFRLSPEDEIAVIEMGMNDFGEIHRLTEITCPTLGLITNVATAHLEKLETLQGVAQAKGELFAKLTPQDTAIVNLKDPEVAKLPTPAQKIGVGTPESGIWGEVLSGKTTGDRPLQLEIHYKDDIFRLSMKLPGAHNLDNILLALCVGQKFHIPLETAREALESFSPAPSRMELVELKSGNFLIDDCYNANPSSTVAALKTLADLKRKKQGVAILGDMLELGNFTREGHERVGRAVAETGIDFLVALGNHAEDISTGAKKGGMSADKIQTFPDVAAALSRMNPFPREVGWILVKGSRGNHLEKLVARLKE